MKRQTAFQYAVAYARIRADLMLTEGPKIAEARRAQARPVEHEPSKQERHRAQSNIQRQQGSL